MEHPAPQNPSGAGRPVPENHASPSWDALFGGRLHAAHTPLNKTWLDALMVSPFRLVLVTFIGTILIFAIVDASIILFSIDKETIFRLVYNKSTLAYIQRPGSAMTILSEFAVRLFTLRNFYSFIVGPWLETFIFLLICVVFTKIRFLQIHPLIIMLAVAFALGYFLHAPPEARKWSAALGFAWFMFIYDWHRRRKNDPRKAFWTCFQAHAGSNFALPLLLGGVPEIWWAFF